jgi:hypothetical protein
MIKLISRCKTVTLALSILPLGLLLTLIPWLIAAHLGVLSRRCYESGWSHSGTALKILAFIIALLTLVWTIWFVIIWLWHLQRVIRGFEVKKSA